MSQAQSRFTTSVRVRFPHEFLLVVDEWAEQHGRPPELFKALRDDPYRRLTREQEAARRRAGQRRRGLQVRAEEVRPVQRSPARRPGDGTNGAE